MRVIVVGCGRVGSALAFQLFKKGHHVTVIDQKGSAFDKLSMDFQGNLIEGDVLARNVLQLAEVESTDALAAVTRSDSLNALVAHIAKTEYNVPRVIARNYDPRQRPLQEAFGIPIVGAASWGARRIEEMLSDSPLRALHLELNTNLPIYQLDVPSTWHGHTLKELLPEEQGVILAWSRSGKPLPINRTQTFEANDILLLTADAREIEALRQRLGVELERTG
jgi:trk system potassium uptake protein TrkA